MSISEIRSAPISAEINNGELLKKMETYYPYVTARAALGTLLFTLNLHEKHVGAPSAEIMKTWKPQIDEVSRDIMQDELRDMPFITISVGSEGAKERLYTDTGEDAPSLQGDFGEKGYGYPVFWKVSDVVEGTDFAVANKPGATSVLAVTPPEGIMPTPKNVHHMVKLIAPPQAKGVMSLMNDHAENLDNLISVLGIKPGELTQVTLNPMKNGKLERPINMQYIEAAKKVGVNLVIIDAGDFVPGIRAGLDPTKKFGNKYYSPMVLVGRGGWEETVLNGAVVKTQGGFMEAMQFDENPEKMVKNPLWTTEDLVPASKESILVSASFITADNKWFNQQGVTTLNEKSHMVTTLVVTYKGLEFKKIQLPL